MRSILSVSLSPDKKKEIEQRAKKANKSVSAYIVHIIDLEKNLISEDELVQMAKLATKEYKSGKTKKLRSLADLN